MLRPHDPNILLVTPRIFSELVYIIYEVQLEWFCLSAWNFLRSGIWLQRFLFLCVKQLGCSKYWYPFYNYSHSPMMHDTDLSASYQHINLYPIQARCALQRFMAWYIVIHFIYLLMCILSVSEYYFTVLCRYKSLGTCIFNGVIFKSVSILQKWSYWNL